VRLGHSTRYEQTEPLPASDIAGVQSPSEGIEQGVQLVRPHTRTIVVNRDTGGRSVILDANAHLA
jgi:hypothetical protein